MKLAWVPDPLKLHGLKHEHAAGIFVLHSLRLAVQVALLSFLAVAFKGWAQHVIQAFMVAIVGRQMYLHWRYERLWFDRAVESSAEARVKAVLKKHMTGDEPAEHLARDILLALKEK